MEGPKRDSDVKPSYPYLARIDHVNEEVRLNASSPSPGEAALRDLSTSGIGLLSSHTSIAKEAEALLRTRYTFASRNEAAVLLALGGDGFMLHTLREMLDGNCREVPVFGMNRGTVGFLMNEWRIDNLADRLRTQSQSMSRPWKCVRQR